MNLQDDKNELPYFIDPKTRFRVLIDTGSTRSFVKNFIGMECYKENLIEDPFEVATAHGISQEKYSTKISLLGKSKHTFYLFDFHKNFDLLLGLDNMKKLKINLDFINDSIDFNGMKLPIYYFNAEENDSKVKSTNPTKNQMTQIKSFLIQARTQSIIEIPIENMNEGEAIVSYKNFSGLEIPQCLVKVKENKAYCSILNPTTSDKKFTIHKPMSVESLENYNCINPSELRNHNACNNLNLLHHKTNKIDLSKIRTNHMNAEEEQAILQVIKDYSDIFHIDGNPLTFTNEIKHIIRTTDEIPVYTRSYRYPEIYRTEVNRQIDEMLEQKIIQPSNSPWNSPIWVIPKKQDASGKKKFRLVIDYRGLNSKTVDDKFPLPNITDILDKLGRAQYFTTLDLFSGFHQIEMDPSSIEKTAFSTDTGHYEFLRMPFGLKNGPPTFQKAMNSILRGLQNELCLVYLDDIIIYSTSLEEHIDRLRQVFERLRQSNFKVQLDKTEFLRKEVSFLGHLVTPNGVKPNPDKVEAIKRYPIPKTTKEIKGFLGLLGYYRKFINNFAHLTKPLTKCLKRNAKIDIQDPEYIKCFETCKNILTNEPILQYPDFEKQFNLTTDASNIAIGAVLSQNKDGADLPCAYASRTLNETEMNYSTIEKELLAIVWATKYFRPYLYGRKFKIFTDHKPLQWLFSMKEPNSKLLRWRLKLEEFDYDICYKKGTANQNADALSRIQLNNNNTHNQNSPRLFSDIDAIINEAIENVVNIIPNEDAQSMIANVDDNETLFQRLENETGTDDNETPFRGFENETPFRGFENDEPDFIGPAEDEFIENNSHTQHSNYESNTSVEIPVSDDPVNYAKNQVILKLVSNNPKKVTIHKIFDSKTRMIVEISENNFDKNVIDFVKEYLVPNVRYSLYFENEFYERFASVIAKNFKFSKLILVRCKVKVLDVTHEDDRIETIDNYHIGKTNHRGIQETYDKIRRKYYWPNMKNYIQNFINKCEICLKTKYERNPLNLEMNLTPTATRPLQIIHMDSITFEKKKFLTIIDSFSRYAQCYPITSCNSVEVADKLLSFFSHHGIPQTIVADNGCEFNNGLVKELTELHKIKMHWISTQHPPSNGLAERFHSTIIEHIRIFNNRDEFKTETIESKVKYAVIAYNNSIHSVTKLTPLEVLYGHIESNPILEIDIQNRFINEYVNNHKEKTKRLFDHIQEINQSRKEHVINERNKDREELPEIPKEVYVRNVQKQSKTKNKFNKETLLSVNRELKTAKINPRHHNTREKIHLSKIKRPRKFKKLNKDQTNERTEQVTTDPNSNPVLPGSSSA